MLTSIIVAVFFLGYLCITLEDVLKVNKAAVALLMCVICWVLYTTGAAQYLSAEVLQSIGDGSVAQYVSEHSLREHLGEITETLFFLMGAMTVVEVIDTNGGFNFVRDALDTRSKRALLWKISFITFFLSAVLDNLTTTIVMIMVLRKLVHNHNDRLIYASLIVAMVIPALLLQFQLKGELSAPAEGSEVAAHTGHQFGKIERNIIFILGVGGLLSVPLFHSFTELPPYMGILLVLGLLWTVTEVFYRRKAHRDSTMKQRVATILHKIDMTTILFFLGILLAVATLKETGVLPAFGQWLNEVSGGNHFLVTGAIGVASSIVDNVPLVAGCMNMYPIVPAGDFASDGIFWQLLAYCAGVGGSMLIIGSAAGVVAMGLEKISFGWYMKKITWVAAAGYFAGILVYYVERVIIHM